jgi:hypothetical protein
MGENGEREETRNFDHERLEVYQLDLKYLSCAHRLCKSMPTGSGSLLDEIGRAAESIVLNIPEGNAKPRGSKDRSIIPVALRRLRLKAPVHGMWQEYVNSARKMRLPLPGTCSSAFSKCSMG